MLFSIATWNVNSLNVRLPHVLQWLKMHSVDVLALQETKTVDEKFPLDEIQAAGYEASYAGQKTYNGVAILSKTPGTDITTDIPKLTDPARRILAASYHGIRIINLYVPNGQSLDSEKFQYKLDWLSKVQAYIKTQLASHERVVIVGDFNIAPEDQDVHDPEAWEGHVLVSPAEREYFQQWLKLGFVDTFRQFEQPEKSYSWWDYRQAAFRRNRGLRIDHILSSKAMANLAQRCDIDPEPRTWERPSDHTPVVAQFKLD